MGALGHRVEWPGWQREGHPAGAKPHGFRLARSMPFPIGFSPRDAAWHGDKRFCCRDTFGHSSIGKVGTGPVKASEGQAACAGETGGAAWGWPGASHRPCADGAEGMRGFPARLVSCPQGHGASKGVEMREREALLLDFC